MDCCQYGEYGGAAQCAGAGWAGPAAYAPYYAPAGYPPAHHYARYYRYDYAAPAHHHALDHAMHMDYGAYAVKEARSRRALTRREHRAHPALQQFPVSHTPPLECGMNSRHGYCEPQMWPHYQMGVVAGNGWHGNGAWPSRFPNMCSRESMRYGPDCRLLKNPQTPVGAPDGRSTPYPVYDNSYESVKRSVSNDFPIQSVPQDVKPARENSEPRFAEEKRPPVVPLPAFQQAFGSTEIGKFAEAFSRADVSHDDCDTFYEPFNDWDGSEWTNTKEIKCEENF